VLNAGAGS